MRARLLSLLVIVVVAGCRPQPLVDRPAGRVPAPTYESLGWEAPWQAQEITRDLDPVDALAYAARTVLDDLEEAERERLLAPFWGFGAPAPVCAAEEEAPTAPAREPWQQEEIHLAAVMAKLQYEWKSDEVALAAFFAGAEEVARVHKRIRKPAHRITLKDLRRRMKRAHRPKLALVEDVLLRAKMLALVWPVERSYRLSSPFGMRIHPVTGREVQHRGVDLATPVGTEVRAAAAGIVRHVRRGAGNGLWVEVDHGDGVRTQYLHLSAFAVKRGQRVAAGELIGFSGATGRVTGPHLHYQLIQGQAHVDPLSVRVARELVRMPLVRSSNGRDELTTSIVNAFVDRALGADAGPSGQDVCTPRRRLALEIDQVVATDGARAGEIQIPASVASFRFNLEEHGPRALR